MLRNRSRGALTTNQALMSDQSSLSSPSKNQTRPISSLFGSARFFNGFLPNAPSETETRSPTSILVNQTFGYDKIQSKLPKNFSGNKQYSWEKLYPKGIGLALVDSLNDENIEKTSNNFSQPILFGSKLKIQIPPLPSSAFSNSPTQSPQSPADFGIKTRNSQFRGSLSSPFGSVNSTTQTKNSPRGFSGSLSVSEMELSEDYTCVISHGPNPRTTHIYDNCIVETCCGVVGLSELKKDYCCLSEKSNSPSESFFGFCYTCKKNLQLGNDIHTYRDEKVFCSLECRCQEMLFDGVENPESDG